MRREIIVRIALVLLTAGGWAGPRVFGAPKMVQIGRPAATSAVPRRAA
jgi:hypothetical protein